MRIVHICLANFYIDNYSYQENILPVYHKKMGNDVTIIASWQSFDNNGKLFIRDYTNYTKYQTKDEIDIYRIPYKKGIYPKVLYQKLRLYEDWINILEVIKPDIVFVHGCQFADINKLIHFVRKNHTKLYIDNHADYINSAKTWYSNLLHRIVWKSYAKKIEPYVTKFWGVTPLRSLFLQDVYKIEPSKIDTLIMGVDIDNMEIDQRAIIRSKLRIELNVEDNDILLISGGKLDKLKGTLKLLEAFIKLKKTNLKLVLFGTISAEIKDEFYKYLNSDERINYIGWVNSDSIFKYFYAADIAIFPGTHSVLWEQSIGIGVPTIIKKWTGFEHLAINESIEEIENITVKNLAGSILKLSKRLDFYTKCGEDNIKIFSYKEIAKKSIS